MTNGTPEDGQSAEKSWFAARRRGLMFQIPLLLVVTFVFGIGTILDLFYYSKPFGETVRSHWLALIILLVLLYILRGWMSSTDAERKAESEEYRRKHEEAKKVERERLARMRANPARSIRVAPPVPGPVDSGNSDLDEAKFAESVRRAWSAVGSYPSSIGPQAPWREQERAAESARSAAAEAENIVGDIRATANRLGRTSEISQIEVAIDAARKAARTYQEYADD